MFSMRVPCAIISSLQPCRQIVQREKAASRKKPCMTRRETAHHIPMKILVTPMAILFRDRLRRKNSRHPLQSIHNVYQQLDWKTINVRLSSAPQVSAQGV